jgi:hypothetical protein
MSPKNTFCLLGEVWCPKSASLTPHKISHLSNLFERFLICSYPHHSTAFFARNINTTSADDFRDKTLFPVQSVLPTSLIPYRVQRLYPIAQLRQDFRLAVSAKDPDFVLNHTRLGNPTEKSFVSRRFVQDRTGPDNAQIPISLIPTLAWKCPSPSRVAERSKEHCERNWLLCKDAVGHVQPA